MFYLDKSMDKRIINILFIMMMTTIAVQCISGSHNLRNITNNLESNIESLTISAPSQVSTLPMTTAKSIIPTTTMVSDLQVAAILFEKHTLQLKINWNTSYINETTYNIIVTPQKSINNECSQKICEEYGLILDKPEVYMPKNPMTIIEDKECQIEFGCAYLIQISSPNGKRIKNITYNVPECIEDSCSCRHEKFLPNITISAQIDFTLNRLLIYWNITTLDNLPDGIFLDSVYIKMGIQNITPLAWGGLYEKIADLLYPLNDVNGDVQLQGNSSYTFPFELKPGRRVLLRGHIIDSNGCIGFDGNATVSIPAANHDSRLADEVNQKWSLAIVLLMVLILIVIISFTIFFQRIRAKNNLGNWPMVYHSVPNSGVLHITMQENSLYVDKEILEARDRGEADQMEISHHCITIGREIGKGAFGRVFIARADHINGKPGSQIVAVKQLKKRPNPDELEEFLWEIATMKKVGKHPNVVNLLGCCTIKQPLLMIMEFVGCGDLLQYLRHVRARHEARSAVVSGIMKQSLTTTIEQQNNQTNQNCIHGALGKYIDLLHNSSSNSDASYITQPDSIPSGLNPSVTETMYTMLSQNPDLTATSNSSSLEYVLDHKELHNFAIQIAYGMKHLEAKQITHRDLAARNILIDENKTLKISDFGLSRTGIYVNTRNKKVPLRWLSIEAMRDNLYSSKSDIWAFGIVLWEIGTLGGFPYPTVGNHELLSYLSSGQRLQRPENCSQLLYDIMLQCWAEHPEDRFSFSELVSKLTPAQQKIYIDFDELSPNYVFPPTIEQTKNNVNGFVSKN